MLYSKEAGVYQTADTTYAIFSQAAPALHPLPQLPRTSLLHVENDSPNDSELKTKVVAVVKPQG